MLVSSSDLIVPDCLKFLNISSEVIQQMWIDELSGKFEYVNSSYDKESVKESVYSLEDNFKILNIK